MPELPEVETIAAGLRKVLADQEIISVCCRETRLRCPVEEKLLRRICCHNTVTQIVRRGKYMVWEFRAGEAVILHLGMSGRFCCALGSEPPARHEIVSWRMANDFNISYQDPRRFGMILSVADGLWRHHPVISKLGPEPLDKIDVRRLQHLAQKRSAAVKLFLMDQQIIAGIGNIYASEILFAAGIHPALPACKLSSRQWNRLVSAIPEILRYAIAAGGTTLQDAGFSDVEGKLGKFQIALRVYGRQNEPCAICQAPILMETIGGRSSFYCPQCQPHKSRKKTDCV